MLQVEQLKSDLAYSLNIHQDEPTATTISTGDLSSREALVGPIQTHSYFVKDWRSTVPVAVSGAEIKVTKNFDLSDCFH